jgi:HPt (histidine-containing phosphotransfer) domain-containing protein
MSTSSALGDRGFRPETFIPQPTSTLRSECDEPIDLPSLLRRCLDDVTFCGMILHKFAARSSDQLAALERALDSGNAIELAREAHTLQGVAANMSAAGMRARADDLERAARAGDFSAARKLYAAARGEVDRCRMAVPELLLRLAH